MDPDPGALDLQAVRRRFDRAAGAFDDADFAHRAAADGLFERMLPMRLQPDRILDLGSATGKASRELARRFRGSRILSLDVSAAMLRAAGSFRSRFSRIRELQADAARIPLAASSVDLVFANLLLPWIPDVPVCISEVSRVLARGGLFVFSSVGPDSLAEIRRAWASVDDDEHVNRFADMHDLGDALVRGGLEDPVLDVDYLTVRYRDAETLFRDLTATGARNCLSGRRTSLTGRERFRAMRSNLEQAFDEGGLPLKLELIFGHAWGGGPAGPPGEYRLDAGSIARRQR